MLCDFVMNHITCSFQFDVRRTSSSLAENLGQLSDGFDRRKISEGPVEQLQVNIDARLIYAVTDSSVSCSSKVYL